MDYHMWQSALTDSTPGAEKSQAILYLYRNGSYVEAFKVTSEGAAYINGGGPSGNWIPVAVVTDTMVAGHYLLADDPPSDPLADPDPEPKPPFSGGPSPYQSMSSEPSLPSSDGPE